MLSQGGQTGWVTLCRDPERPHLCPRLLHHAGDESCGHTTGFHQPLDVIPSSNRSDLHMCCGGGTGRDLSPEAARAARTKYHGLGTLNTDIYFSPVLGNKSDIRGGAGVFPLNKDTSHFVLGSTRLKDDPVN